MAKIGEINFENLSVSGIFSGLWGNLLQYNYNDKYREIRLWGGSINHNTENLMYISFDFKTKDPNFRDWSHIFSFGTHDKHGGDNPSLPIAYYMPREGIQGLDILDTLPSFNIYIFHTYGILINKINNIVQYYIDNRLIKSINTTNYYSTVFYMCGTGSGHQSSGYIKNMICYDKFTLTDKYHLFNKENEIYI